MTTEEINDILSGKEIENHHDCLYCGERHETQGIDPQHTAMLNHINFSR